VQGRPLFRDAYVKRRCILPIDGFFEWTAVRGDKVRQPFAIAMKDGAPFAPADYECWLSDEPDPRALLKPFPAEPMRLWPVSTRVNSVRNDDPGLIEPVAAAGG